VKEVAQKAGVEVEVPDNFLTLVAERHLRPAQKTKGEAADKLAGLVQGLMPTRTLYYEDSYQTSFTARQSRRSGITVSCLTRLASTPRAADNLRSWFD